MIFAMQDLIINHCEGEWKEGNGRRKGKEGHNLSVKFWPRTPLILWALAHELILILPLSLK